MFAVKGFSSKKPEIPFHGTVGGKYACGFKIVGYSTSLNEEQKALLSNGQIISSNDALEWEKKRIEDHNAFSRAMKVEEREKSLGFFLKMGVDITSVSLAICTEDMSFRLLRGLFPFALITSERYDLSHHLSVDEAVHIQLAINEGEAEAEKNVDEAVAFILKERETYNPFASF